MSSKFNFYSDLTFLISNFLLKVSKTKLKAGKFFIEFFVSSKYQFFAAQFGKLKRFPSIVTSLSSTKEIWNKTEGPKSCAFPCLQKSSQSESF